MTFTAFQGVAFREDGINVIYA